MRDTHRQQNIESLSSSWITQLCAPTAPGGWGAAEPRSGSWQRRNKKRQEGRVLPKEKVVVLIILPFFFVGVFATKDLKIMNKKELSKHKGGLGGWWCCRSREEGRPHPLLQVTIAGWWCLRFTRNFLSQSRLEVSLSDLVQVVLTKNAFSGIQTHNFAGAVKKLPQVFPSRDHHDQQPNIIKIVIVSKRQLADRPWRVLFSVATIISTGNCGRNINDKI